jgi:hypothetical protein
MMTESSGQLFPRGIYRANSHKKSGLAIPLNLKMTMMLAYHF